MIADDKSRCMSEHGTKQEEIDEVSAGVIKNEPSITCYMYCMLEAFSLVSFRDDRLSSSLSQRKLFCFQVDDEAQLETEMMVGLLPESLQDKANNVLSKCTPTSGTDNCNKIFNLATCVQQSAPDVSCVRCCKTRLTRTGHETTLMIFRVLRYGSWFNILRKKIV
nr:PREDICTED: general odorant-binding protein 69a-like isoform X3 [Megachile rotundata]